MHHSLAHPSVCEFCGETVEPANVVDVVVPDSGYLDPTDPNQDGRRPTRACSREHADRLIERGNARWVDEQLWARKFSRVSASWNSQTTNLDTIAKQAGLTRHQLRRMTDWRFRAD